MPSDSIILIPDMFFLLNISERIFLSSGPSTMTSTEAAGAEGLGAVVCAVISRPPEWLNDVEGTAGSR